MQKSQRAINPLAFLLPFNTAATATPRASDRNT
jgi:hypothetical protein